MAVTPTHSVNQTPTLQKTDSPAKIKKAAEDFEALLIGQMLTSVRESSTSGWGNSDQAGNGALEMADQHIAQLIASNGGLGLARLISAGLETQHQTNPMQTGSES